MATAVGLAASVRRLIKEVYLVSRLAVLALMVVDLGCLEAFRILRVDSTRIRGDSCLSSKIWAEDIWAICRDIKTK